MHLEKKISASNTTCRQSSHLMIVVFIQQRIVLSKCMVLLELFEIFIAKMLWQLAKKPFCGTRNGRSFNPNKSKLSLVIPRVEVLTMSVIYNSYACTTLIA